MDKVKIGIIGDYNPNLFSHPATNAAIEHTASYLNISVDFDWISTQSIQTESGYNKLATYDGLWASSGSPYLSMDGALSGIRYAREQNRPLFGT